jgi:hypothetical protein
MENADGSYYMQSGKLRRAVVAGESRGRDTFGRQLFRW